MKQFLYFILYLNIYTILSEGIQAQNLQLELKAEKEFTKGFLDTLQPQLTFNNFKMLSAEVDSLTPKFQAIGYLDARLVELDKRNDSLYHATWHLGNKWEEIKIFYKQEDFVTDEIELISQEVTTEYFVIPISKTEESLRYLNDLKTEKGNSFAKLNLSNLTKQDNTTMTARLNVSGGPVRTIDHIVIKGYEKFPRSYLTYYTGIKKGKPFHRKKIIEQNEELNNLGFVQTIKPPEALFRKDSTSIYFYLEKKNNNLFDGILGFATNDETQKLEFNGYLNLELNNNLNYGEQLLINYKADGREQQNFRVRATMPYLFKTPFGVSAELKIFKRDSTFSTTDQQARVSYQLNPTSNIYTGYKTYESSNLLDVIIAGSTVEDFDSKYLLLGASYEKRQTRSFFPIKTFIGIESEIGNRTTSDATEDQFRIIANLSHIFRLNLKNSIYLKNSSSVLSSETYLTNELFRFGGINSIRGFSENSIDASLFSVLNTEYRYLLGATTYIHSIIDLAYFENQTLNLKEELYSFGLGLGLQTEAGIFKLNIANGVSTEQNFKFSNTKIHISLSSRF
ncbi:MAG: POTRA domain-containing protein [Bacteroidota bacterium]